jgi:hypothetical protein
MAKSNVDLTAKQKILIERLQNGDVLVTSNEGAWISGPNGQDEQIPLKTFWNLVEKDLIFQQLAWPFNYELTNLGKTIPLSKRM